MSGRGAPDLTERPTAARAKIVLEPSTTLPLPMTLSITLVVCTIRSAGAFETSLCSSSALVSCWTSNLWPVIRVNAGASSFNAEIAPMDARTTSSDIFLTLHTYAERFGDPGRGRHVRSYECRDFLRRAADDFH